MLGPLRTRLALLGTELREELLRFAGVLIGAGVALALGLLALGAAVLALILAAPPEHRAAVAALVAAVFAASVGVIVWRVRAALAAKPVPFAASLAQLEADEREMGRLVSIGVLAYSIGRRLRG